MKTSQQTALENKIVSGGEKVKSENQLDRKNMNIFSSCPATTGRQTPWRKRIGRAAAQSLISSAQMPPARNTLCMRVNHNS
jgi:hypothetical protein